MQTTQDRARDDASTDGYRLHKAGSCRNTLPDALMRAFVVEIGCIRLQNLSQVRFMQDQHMIETFTTDGADKPLAHCIGFRCTEWCLEDCDACPLGDSPHMLSILAIVIAQQITRSLAEGRGLPDLLSYPRVGGLTCHFDMHHAA
jgi:hypothetical protein